MSRSRTVPTVRLRRLAAQLRQLREAAGLTQEDVAERTGKDRSTLYRLENAQQRPQRSTLIQLMDLYGVERDKRAELLAVLRQAGELGWVRGHRSHLPEVYSDYISFESEASTISNYESLFVPGLLQTEDYTRAVIRGTLPHATDEQVENRVAARMERQAVLAKEDPARLWAIMDEAVVRRAVGGPGVMRQQLRRIAEAASKPNLTAQIIPYAAGAHPGMQGSFILLDFPDPADPSLIYMESLAGDLFLENSTDISRYIENFQHLRAAALRPDETIALLAEVADNL
jgi:transcriptional regulator with XRE-family HTH domain